MEAEELLKLILSNACKYLHEISCLLKVNVVR